MQYFESAPKSPKQGGASQGPARPQHYYNYAQHNNRTASSMQYPNLSQTGNNPYQPNPPYNLNGVNALPEDQTQIIEDLDGQGNKSSDFLTILLIGLTVLILLVGGIGGGVYLYRHVRSGKGRPTRPRGNQTETDELTSREEALSESRESGNSYESSSEEATMPMQRDENPLTINQIYLINVHAPEEIVGYIPQNQLLYSSLLELKGIAQIFETPGWSKEEGMTHHAMHNGLYDYFAMNKRDIGVHDLSGAESLSKEYKLITKEGEPMTFYVLSDEHHLGVELQLQALIFKTGNSIFTSDNQQLHHISMISPAQVERRRLMPSGLPSEQSILANIQIFTLLPSDYHGTTYNDLQVAISPAQPMQSNMPIHHGSLDPNAPTLHLQLGIGHEFMRHQMHPYHPNTPEQQIIDAELTSCHPETFNEMLQFEKLTFTLTVSWKDVDKEIYDCVYESAREVLIESLHHQRTLQSDAEPSASGESVEVEPEEYRSSNDRPITDVDAALYPVVGEDDGIPLRERLDEPGSLDEPGAGAMAAQEEQITLNLAWLHKISQSSHTLCTNDARPGHDVKTLCETIKSLKEQYPPRRRLAESEPDENCDCLDACGMQFKVTDEGNTLELMQCHLNIYASKFDGILGFDPSKISHIDLSFGRQYDVDEHAGVVHTTGVPYWRCSLIPDSSADPSPDSSDVQEEFRRVLVVDQDTSNAWSKDNMFIIIASTIFCIFIGIQSYFLLISP